MNLNEIWIKIKVNIDEASKNIGEFGKKLDSFGNKAVAIGNSMGKVADPMMGGLMKGVSVVTAGIGGIAAAALKVGGDFEHAMLMVQGVAGATEAQFKQMSDAAAKLGEDLPISATEAAEAMYSLASAGLSTEEILASVQHVAAISIAQNYDLASSAEMVVGAMSVYGLAAEQAGRITDAFANATKSSQLNMEKMKYALAGAGKDAARLGLDLEQTLAALGVLADTNMDGSTMGTGLKSVLLSLVSPTEEMARLFRKIGYEAVDADGKLKPLEETFRVLREAGMSSADAVAFFGKEASGVADVLINNADKMTRLEEVMRTTGSAQALLENQMKSLKNHLKGLSSALGQSLIITFNGIKKETKELVNTGTEAVRAFNGWAEKTDVVAKSIVGFSEGLGLASLSAKSFAESLKKISVDDVVKKFEGIGEGIAKVGKGFSDLNEHIPWGVLIDNIEGIGLAIIGFWSLAKVTAIAGNIAIFGGALISLAETVFSFWQGTLVPMFAWLAANPEIATLMAIAGALTWLGKQLWDCADAWFNWGKARREAQLAEERANEFEGISKDYVDAVKGSADALDKLPPKYRELAEASIKAKKEMMEQIKGMGGEKADVLLEIMQEYPEAFRLIWTAVAEEAEKGMAMLPEKLRARYMEAFKEMEWVKKKLGQQKDMFSNPEDLQAEWASRQAGKTRQSISEVDYAIARVQDRLKEIKAQGAQAMESFGLSTAEAGAIMKEELLKTVTEFKDGLEKESPYMARSFVNALEQMGKEGGDAMMNAVAEKLREGLNLPLSELTDGEALRQSLKDLHKNMLIARRQAEEAMANFGVPKENAMETFREQVTKEASRLQSELANKNPHLAAAFVKALSDAGKRGGNKLFQEVAKALQKTKEAGQSAFSEMDNGGQESWIDGKKTIYQNADFSHVEKEIQRVKALISSGYRQLDEENEREIITSWTQNGKAVTEIFDKTFATIKRQSVDLFETVVPKEKGASSEGLLKNIPSERDLSKVKTVFSDLGFPVDQIRKTGEAFVAEADRVAEKVKGSLSKGELPIPDLSKGAELSAATIGDSIVAAITNAFQKSSSSLEAASATMGTMMGNAMGQSMESALMNALARVQQKASTLKLGLATGGSVPSQGLGEIPSDGASIARKLVEQGRML